MTWLMPSAPEFPKGELRNLAGEIRFSSRKSFGCRILPLTHLAARFWGGGIFAI
jgi:hypothetical protein